MEIPRVGPRRTIRCPRCNRGIRLVRREPDGLLQVSVQSQPRRGDGRHAVLRNVLSPDGTLSRRRLVSFKGQCIDATPPARRGTWTVTTIRGDELTRTVFPDEVSAQAEWRRIIHAPNADQLSEVSWKPTPPTHFRFVCAGDRHRFDRTVKYETLEKLYLGAVSLGGDVVLLA